MSKIINCECGQVIRASDDQDLVAKVDDHIKSDHPDLIGRLSREDVLNMAEEQ
jgi:predicted small metal-binding protein